MSGPRGVRIVEAREALEDGGFLAVWDAGSVVLDGDHRMPFALRHFDAYWSALGRVSGDVFEEGAHDPTDLSTFRGRARGGQHGADAVVAPPEDAAQLFDRSARLNSNVGLRVARRAFFGLGEFEQVVDERGGFLGDVADLLDTLALLHRQ